MIAAIVDGSVASSLWVGNLVIFGCSAEPCSKLVSGHPTLFPRDPPILLLESSVRLVGPSIHTQCRLSSGQDKYSRVELEVTLF